jgi:hypothetical protein
MEEQLKHYEFINSQTGNILSYLSLPANLDAKELKLFLERRQQELASLHKLFIELIYWQDHEHCIR